MAKYKVRWWTYVFIPFFELMRLVLQRTEQSH
jgi:hypothetical protein